MKKHHFDLSQLDWQLTGWIPEQWRLQYSFESGAASAAEVPPIPAKVPGSVQFALQEAGIIPDWNVGMNFRECEWVENRHWIYEAALPDEWFAEGKTFRLNCRGLDYCGSVFVNGQTRLGVQRHPHAARVRPHSASSRQQQPAGDNLRMPAEVARAVRLHIEDDRVETPVQLRLGLDCAAGADRHLGRHLSIEAVGEAEIETFRCVADADGASGVLRAWGKATGGASLSVTLVKDGQQIRSETLPSGDFDLTWTDLPVDLWQPNMQGDQPLYDLTCRLLGTDRSEIDTIQRRVGFSHIEWQPCEGAPEGADPWICVVNGKPVFLQGANWVPIRPNFADVTEADYRKRLELYRDLGCNMLRVWGGATLETRMLLRSLRRARDDGLAGVPAVIVGHGELAAGGREVDRGAVRDRRVLHRAQAASRVARHLVRRKRAYRRADGGKVGGEKPVDLSHPLIARFAEIVAHEDPTRRFLPTSSSGPTFYAHPQNYGKGLHWDIHGPWKADGDLDGAWTDYWAGDDSLFRSETGIARRLLGGDHPQLCRRPRPLSRHGRQSALEPAHELVGRVAALRRGARARARKISRNTSPGARRGRQRRCR